MINEVKVTYHYTNSDGELILLDEQKLETPWTLCQIADRLGAALKLLFRILTNRLQSMSFKAKREIDDCLGTPFL